ncbi:hypothetical protein [Pelagibacterium sediminicola]|uniref:hypothetical protein n=1 Tax=Pelagibacterium sediminicola TaxID=2248761 RepID=UPI000E30CE5A|nr:hypothetical protein [Pelagibacterium sediminicola]
MKKVLLSRFVSAALAATLVLPVGAGAAFAQGACWDNAAIQAAVASGQILSLADARAREGIPGSTQILDVKVCEQGGAPVYVIAVLEASGEARNLTISAR